jgi:hypothetical protein
VRLGDDLESAVHVLEEQIDIPLVLFAVSGEHHTSALHIGCLNATDHQ